jgi:FkbM family methyltransferase
MKLLRRIVQRGLGSLGYQLTRKQPPRLGHTLQVLKGLGLSARHVVDVGANRGGWTREAVKYFPGARYTLVEPQEHLRAHVQDLVAAGHAITWVTAGAGDYCGKLEFTFSERDDSSSFFPSAGEGMGRAHNRREIDIRTVNDIVASAGVGPPEVIKIDAEGFDLKVLAGASDFHGVTEVFFIEVAFGEPQFPNTLLRVTEEMARIGYRPFDISELVQSPRTGALWLCEVAYIRSASPLLAGMSKFE